MIRKFLLGAACLAALSTAAHAQAASAAPQAPVPRGKLPDAARPTAYRLNFRILPDQANFSGHTEIDAQLKTATSQLYLHGKGLKVAKVTARVGSEAVPATWTEVDPSGVARLDFARPLPAGPVTLAFDYEGGFRDNPSGLYHIKVGDQWYSWTQFESTDARAAFPGFDEPGFKTPFTVSVETRSGLKVISNAPEAAVVRTGEFETHRFEPTKPLPTYLVAIDTGPFLHPTTTIPPNAHRSHPLPLDAAATQAQAGKLDYVLAETPRIVGLLESYFGQPFPFPKLDQIASPSMPGAMENAGADTYADEIILLDKTATPGQRAAFGMVVSHELAHQWFGDLVTPAWWDDIWLNESFANWMGYRIGNAWRPELDIGVGAVGEGLAAMTTDALEVGRPIHQHIETNDEIDGAFDQITYGKGGQVIAMIAAYMGDEKFRDGVRLHLSRHRYGNATTEDFFKALADSGKDPRILAAMRSFVDQPGVPVVRFERQGGRLVATQSRYAFLGGAPKPQLWTIPLCLSAAPGQRQCTLLDQASAPVAAPQGAYLMPNAGGTGYYRFDLPRQDWQALIAAVPTLPVAEALAEEDSLWASFAAGRAPAVDLVAEAKAAARHPNSAISVAPLGRFAELRLRGVLPPEAVADYRRMVEALYAPKLKAVGLDLRVGAYASETPEQQRVRQALVGALREAEDPELNERLIKAAERALAGDAAALDPAFMQPAFIAYARAGGLLAAKTLLERGLSSEDAVLRSAALGAASRTGRQDAAQWILSLEDPRLRPPERLQLIFGLVFTPETRDLGSDWLLNNYEALARGANGIFFLNGITRAFQAQCSASRAEEIRAKLEPRVRAAGVGLLEFERTLEDIRHCAALKDARGAELAAALKG